MKRTIINLFSLSLSLINIIILQKKIKKYYIHLYSSDM